MADRISQLPDELLLKVLFFLPTRTAVSTSVLSKRWEFLWMFLPKLEYEYTNLSSFEKLSLRTFVNLNMPLHKAPVIETFRLKLTNSVGSIKSKDIKLWVVIAVSRCLRELSINLHCAMCRPAKMPSSLYTCESLVVLKLIDEIFVDVPRIAYLPSLTTLLLRRVTYLNDKSLQRLLSSCPVLEDLVMERVSLDFPGYPEDLVPLNVTMPSLQRLALKIGRYVDLSELVINTPCLKYFKLLTHYNCESEVDPNYSYDFKDMPKLEDADIESRYPDTNNFIRSITSVKRLSLCIRSLNAEEALNCDGIVFNQLKNLKLCPCDTNWSKLLARLLEKSPSLRELEICLNDIHKDTCVDPPLVSLESELSPVPECMRSSLETFEWKGIHGSQKEIDVVKYILRNACGLKTAAILSQSTPETEDKRKVMIQELLLSFRSSATCQLVLE